MATAIVHFEIPNRARLGLAIVLLISMAGCQGFAPLAMKSAAIDNARQLTNSGVQALQDGRPEQAARMFAQAAEQNPDDQRIRGHLAKSLSDQGKISTAIRELELATQRSNDTALRVQLGNLYLDQGKWLQANRQADQALAQNNKSVPALILKGDTELAKGNGQQALNHFQRALSIEANLPDVQLRVAQTYQRLGKPLRALATVEQILSQHPNDRLPINLQIAKGVALIDSNQLSSAIDVLRTASLDDDATSEVFFRLGQAHLASGNISEARLTLNQAQQRFPQSNEIGTLVAQLKTELSDVAVNSK